MQPAPPTGTQGKQSLQHEIEVPPSLVGRPGTSEELGSTPQTSYCHPSTTVHMHGYSGDSGSHRKSLVEDIMTKTEFGIEASAKARSSQTHEYTISLDYQSFNTGYNNKNTKEADQTVDMEEISEISPEVPLVTNTDRAAESNSQGENLRLKPRKVHTRSLPRVQISKSRI